MELNAFTLCLRETGLRVSRVKMLEREQSFRTWKWDALSIAPYQLLDF